MRRIKRYGEKWNIQKIWEQYSSILLAVLLTVIFSFRSEDYLSWGNFEAIVLSHTSLMIVVAGLSFIMISGGIDLSVGYQISMVSVVISMLSMGHYSAGAVIAGALLTGALCGLCNGILVACFDIVSFAATLATQIILRGLSWYLSNGSMVSYMPGAVRQMTRARWLGIRVDIWLMLLCLLVFWIVLRLSFYGKYLRALGLNEEAAGRAGVRVKLIKCSSYCLAGVFYALAAIIMTSRRGYAGSEIGVGMEITGIAAAYIGGILGQAAKPRILTLILGVLIVGMIDNGLPKIGINSQVQYMITGIILIIAMALHKTQRNNHIIR